MSDVQRPATVDADPSARRKTISLLILCAAVFLDSLDNSVLGVSLPSIKHALSLSDGALQWLVSGYTVGYGGFLLLGGRAADLFGRKRTFIAATVVFIIASLLGGVFTDGSLLVGTRVLKGIAAGFTAPAAMSLITTTFKEGAERNRALGIFAMTGAGGYSFGLVLSGVLTEINWRLVFFVPALIAFGVLLASPMIIGDKSGSAARRRGSFDLGGAISATAGVMLLVYGLVQAPAWGWGSAAALGTLAGAVVLLVAFVLIEARHRAPLVPLSIFRSSTLSSANLVSVVWACSTIGWQFVASLYLQETLHYSALQTAFAFLPLGVVIVITAKFASGPLVSRFGVRTVATAGMLIQGVGVVLFLRIGHQADFATVLLPAILIHGIGNGLVYPTVNIAGVSGVADERQGVASGLITAAYQIGAGVGVAVLAAVLTATATTGSGAGVVNYRWAFLVAAVFSAAGVLIALFGIRPKAAASTPVAGALADEPATADTRTTTAG
ncbi:MULTISPECIES: MFS transporter [Kitasatospora]|uniref:MFS transporter n=1 Tax=Kitasatospora TaxID=2063 RepID=UPI000CBD5D3E|nr:MFS transporter [Kitasatospora sp. GP30]MDH6138632.1 EmrB/QacA subfamily drug resistance transporter [Kitasatospora sp. GP30]